MTPQDLAYEAMCKKIGYRPKFRSCLEHETAYAFRMGPSDIIFVMKDSGKAYWNYKMPVGTRPLDRGREIPLWDHL